ncbi:DUF2269 family protein [sulfur-oxidizing endosymbiont of Gigantopelta aegis]|uniref:DUF2269 family protein n=1 Tax=sulfur-oxidizing endosymbiont of Gigantopelta aegis TaxID=2794934 RepID=UPI0018DC7372|nr:DUF2269 domain-containing protein [sulfur-oxidizing endosymbiont of Gigantopelta aegis]
MYLSIKLIHIISATLLFGTGLGSAFYMFMAYRSGNMIAMAETNRIVVLADFCFTTPTVIIQLVTGLYLLNALGIEWTSPWSLSVLGLYLFVGLCWLPVVWLQIWLRDRALQLKTPDTQYKLRMKIWLILGIMAFPSVIILYAFMVYKPFFNL